MIPVDVCTFPMTDVDETPCKSIRMLCRNMFSYTHVFTFDAVALVTFSRIRDRCIEDRNANVNGGGGVFLRAPLCDLHGICEH